MEDDDPDANELFFSRLGVGGLHAPKTHVRTSCGSRPERYPCLYRGEAVWSSASDEDILQRIVLVSIGV